MKWVQAGYRVTVVSMTTGDAGHYEMSGGVLARRRIRECQEAAERGGYQSIVLENHDGELLPTIEVRKAVTKVIREQNANLVISHRPNDYHPDHRYTAQVVQDAAYMVTVPNFAPDVISLRQNPVFMYFMDRFQKPYPFQADIAVDIDDVMTTKWRILDAMESQLYEWLPWHDGYLNTVPEDHDERLQWLPKRWDDFFLPVAKLGRDALTKWYGRSAAAKVTYTELFEICEYGAHPTDDEIRLLFPFLPAKPRSASKSARGKRAAAN